MYVRLMFEGVELELMFVFRICTEQNINATIQTVYRQMEYTYSRFFEQIQRAKTRPAVLYLVFVVRCPAGPARRSRHCETCHYNKQEQRDRPNLADPIHSETHV